MDSRQRRVNRIAQALIEQGLINSDNENTDEDFQSSSSSESTKSDSSMTQSEEEKEIDQKELEKQQRQKKKQEKEEFDSLKDALRSRIRSSYKIKDQFKLTDEEFTKHLAVTTVWNNMSRERAARQLLTENIQTERTQEIYRPSDRPFTATIQADSPQRAFQAILDIHYGPQQAHILMEHLKKGTTPDEWNTVLESKQLPDDCNYEKLFQSYQRSIRNYQTAKRVVKVSYHDGRLSRLESLELANETQFIVPSMAQMQEAEAQLQNKNTRGIQYNTKLKTVIPGQPTQNMMLVNGKVTPIININQRKRSKNQITFDAALKHQQELYNRAKQMAQEIQNSNAHVNGNTAGKAPVAAPYVVQTKNNIQVAQSQNNVTNISNQQSQQNNINQHVETIQIMKPFGMYNIPKKPGPVVDQSGYPTNPNAKEVQTNVSLIEQGDVGKTITYKIIATTPKRNQFNKFYNVISGKPCPYTMNIMMQTELSAKQVRGSTIIEKGQGEGSNAYLLFDGNQYELSKITKAQQIKLLKNCTELQINRWKGRQGSMLNDFLELVKKVRPDLYAQGDALFVSNKTQYNKNINEKQSKKEQEREGVWVTLDGLWSEYNTNNQQIEVKIKDENDEVNKLNHEIVNGQFVEVAHTTVDDFYVGREVIEYRNDNGYQCPSFLDKFYTTFSSIDEQREYAKNMIKGKYQQQFKYTHPVTGIGYNTIEEYKKIEQDLKKAEQNKIKPIVNKLEELQQEFQKLIDQEDFIGAQEVYVQMNKLIVPTYLQYRDENLPDSRLGRIKLPIIDPDNKWKKKTATDIDYLNNENILDRDFKVNKVLGFAGTIQNVGRQIYYTNPFKQLD